MKPIILKLNEESINDLIEIYKELGDKFDEEQKRKELRAWEGKALVG